MVVNEFFAHLPVLNGIVAVPNKCIDAGREFTQDVSWHVWQSRFTVLLKVVKVFQ